jgi:hypothetical protein
MTLDALSTALSPLLSKHPDGALLLLGLPGLPNTTWPTSQPLSAPNQARAVNKLLKHLISSGILDKHQYIKSGVPIVWVGLGNGVQTMLHLATQQQQEGGGEDEGEKQAAVKREEDARLFSSRRNNNSDASDNSIVNSSDCFDELKMMFDQSVLFLSVNGFAHVDPQLRKVRKERDTRRVVVVFGGADGAIYTLIYTHPKKKKKKTNTYISFLLSTHILSKKKKKDNTNFPAVANEGHLPRETTCTVSQSLQREVHA